jgi:hypothetical protein
VIGLGIANPANFTGNANISRGISEMSTLSASAGKKCFLSVSSIGRRIDRRYQELLGAKIAIHFASTLFFNSETFGPKYITEEIGNRE